MARCIRSRFVRLAQTGVSRPGPGQKALDSLEDAGQSLAGARAAREAVVQTLPEIWEGRFHAPANPPQLIAQVREGGRVPLGPGRDDRTDRTPLACRLLARVGAGPRLAGVASLRDMRIWELHSRASPSGRLPVRSACPARGSTRSFPHRPRTCR